LPWIGESETILSWRLGATDHVFEKTFMNAVGIMKLKDK